MCAVSILYLFYVLDDSALGQNDQLLQSKKMQSEITTTSSHCCLAK